MLRREFLTKTAIFALLGLTTKSVDGKLSTEKNSVSTLINEHDAEGWQFKEIEKWYEHYKGQLYIVYNDKNPIYKIDKWMFPYPSDLWKTSLYSYSDFKNLKTYKNERAVHIFHTSLAKDVVNCMNRDDSFIGWDESGIEIYKQIIREFHSRENPTTKPLPVSWDDSKKVWYGHYTKMQTTFKFGNTITTNSYLSFPDNQVVWEVNKG